MEPSSFFLKNKSSLDTVAEDEEFKQEEEFAEYPTYFSSYQRGDTVVIFGDPSHGMVLGDGFQVYLKRQHTNASLPSRVFTSTYNQMLGVRSCFDLFSHSLPHNSLVYHVNFSPVVELLTRMYYALRRDISHDPLSLHVLTSLGEITFDLCHEHVEIIIIIDEEDDEEKEDEHVIQTIRNLRYPESRCYLSG